MPISETGRSTDPAAGFTLIELVAVMTVISILALALVAGTGAGSLMGRDSSHAAGSVARTLESAVTTARATAFHTRAPHGLLPRPDGWDMLARDRDNGGWRLVGEGRAAGLGWVINGTAHFPVPPQPDAPPRPLVIFASDGRATGFAVDFPGAPDRFRCATDGWEVLRCARR